MSSIADKLHESIRGKYFKHAGTGVIIQVMGVLFPADHYGPDTHLLNAQDLNGKDLTVPYKDITQYRSLSEPEIAELYEGLKKSA